jgi:signal transduction histidine kinase
VKAAYSVRWRLVGALAGVSLFTLVVVGLVFYVFLGGYVLDRQQEQLLDQAIQVAEQVQGLGESLPAGGAGTKVTTLLLRSQLRVLPTGAGIAVFRGSEVVAKVGALPFKQPNLERLRLRGEQLGGLKAGGGAIKSVVDAAGRQVDTLIAAAPVQLSGDTRGLVVVTLARAEAFSVRAGVLRTLLVSGVIAIALAVMVGWALGAWMARPLRRLSSAARGMAEGSYEKPVGGSYPGEVQELATSLETMRQEVRRSEESLRGFVASAAHELRTPLTSIQGFSQALLDGTAATPEQRQRSAVAIYRESVRLQRLVDALLTLSRYDSHGFQPSLASVPVDALIGEEVERLIQIGLAAPGRIAVHVESGARVITDGDMLRQVIANLLRNAVQYGGSDPVTVRVWTRGRELMFEVANGGEPLAPVERTRIFDRFYRGRAGQRVDGFGLGLALVWEICDVLGGRVELAQSGPLTRFRVTIPVDPAVVR